MVARLAGVLYTTQEPPWGLMCGAAVMVLFIAGGVAVMDHRVEDRISRSSRPDLPLAPPVVWAATHRVFAGPVSITVLIPAHNEEKLLPAAIASLRAQTRQATRVIVVADNCDDATAQVAQHAGCEVFETVNNHAKKAGALNQALAWLLPDQGENDMVMVMDADTRLNESFLAEAITRFTQDRALMAVGGLFYGEHGHGLLGQFQRNEYFRYGRQIRRRRGRVFVLTGTASIFRPRALRTVAEQRGALLPGTPGDVYDTASLTEDNELTIALKTLGALMTSPMKCTVVTELMPGWPALWAQRLRWQRGALENLGSYGFTPQTLRNWAQQLGIGYSVLALGLYLTLTLLTLLAVDTWVWFPLWVGLGLIFVLERVATVWEGGWRARLLALTLFPELLYDMFLNLVFIQGIIDITRGRKATWKHLRHRHRSYPPGKRRT